MERQEKKAGKKRLALLCQHFYPEMISTGMHMTELALALRRLGWDITVYCAQPTLSLDSSGQKQVAKEMTYEGIRIIRVPTVGTHAKGLLSRFLFASTYLLSTFKDVIRNSEQFDGMMATTNPPFIGLAARLASAILKKPYVMLIYDVYPDIAVSLGLFKARSSITRTWDRLSRVILNGAEAIVVIGRDMAKLVKSKLREENSSRMHLIPNWSDERVVSPINKDENPFRHHHHLDGQVLVQYSGRMGMTHNLEPLVLAAEQLQDQPIVFQFIGDGAKKEKLQEMVVEKKLGNVHFLPYQPLERLGEVLSAADLSVVCLESKFTGLSVPSKTYGLMASGTPILGFLDLYSEIGLTIQENVCGLVFKDPTGSEVAEAIRSLMQTPEKLAKMGRNGHRAFLDNYTLSLAAERYNRLLMQCFYQQAKEAKI